VKRGAKFSDEDDFMDDGEDLKDFIVDSDSEEKGKKKANKRMPPKKAGKESNSKSKGK